ncbi:MAG: aminotransferase class V-fold PLP-dependent enzyme [Bacteroidales bacterium]|jgi:cysteine desulfurase family protein|nr:aminotransferase class V-fold PLP-dependent enzyme [Bacteroidales bacterium]MBP5411918.1 aminotransferase class V-fold PLP-dependent enzyme [Bacteroidales bacterium]MBQ4477249.1 aminotransferase class V-fold PLP-dependent enzyme [Bacteroidales bacterium]MBR4453096.1 aminotransferase class V-fold PLP-dependent enzyme [Bacteroidales bacterium]MCR5555580.1 aminotransferase class V-fold PLP-dependent enzyme [Bacteroidales bacterium]
MIYLDNSATSFPKPDVVYDFMTNFYRKHGVNPGRSGFDAAVETEEIVFNTRKLLTELFNGGGDPNRLTFSYNATDSLNIVLQGLAEKGKHVITTMLEHNSVLRPLYCMQQQGIIDVTYIPFNKDGYVDPDDIKKAIRPNTKFVACTHSSNVIGTIQPLKEIGKICKDNGLIFVVDGSQGAGSVPLDMVDCGIDVYVFTGHKCLMGPTGIGGSYVREGIDIRQTRFGGTGVRSAVKTHLEEYPYRLEAGTINLLGIAGLNAGVKWIKEQGIENIHQREILLWDKLRKGLQSIEGVTTYCANSIENQNPVLSFNIKGFDAGDVGTMLDVDYDIACRTGLQCAPRVHEQIGTIDIHGTVRLSVGAFTTDAEIDTAINAVKEIAAIRN